MVEAQVELLPEVQALLEQEEHVGRTTIMVAENGRLIGLLALEDTVGAEAQAALDWLRQLGIQRMTILSGDRPAAVGAVGRALRVEDVRGGLLPEEKEAVVAGLVEGVTGWAWSATG